jgi:hypothetical protein
MELEIWPVPPRLNPQGWGAIDLSCNDEAKRGGSGRANAEERTDTGSGLVALTWPQPLVEVGGTHGHQLHQGGAWLEKVHESVAA